MGSSLIAEALEWLRRAFDLDGESKIKLQALDDKDLEPLCYGVLKHVEHCPQMDGRGRSFSSSKAQQLKWDALE